jgi:hypothetical protein
MPCDLVLRNVGDPAYSCDNAPSDYFLFPSLKQSLSGQKFKDDPEDERF